ncbi:MAG: methionine adenosyltransferase [Betaproteobacteria bacterium]|nr:MAG: methionine adenosyltransferase [Betaproteobacteria bacterium]
MIGSNLFTSEAVTAGHPDKLCDQISDAIVDSFLTSDRAARINAECAVAHGVIFIAASYAASTSIDIPEVARTIIKDVGYETGEFNAADCSVLTSIRELPAHQRFESADDELDSSNLDALTVSNQVTAFGYACRHTDALMPLPIWLARHLCQRLHERSDKLKTSPLSPDATVQVGIEFKDRQPKRIHSINFTVHSEQACDTEDLRAEIVSEIIKPVVAKESIRVDKRTRIFLNHQGPILSGGPVVHSGLTGRKTAVDTYGQFARHSESAQSGKDPLRIDRVAAYAARHAAKNVVAAGLADECELLLSYSMGLAGPVSVQFETFGTEHFDQGDIHAAITRHFDFRLGAIVRDFALCDLPAEHSGNFYRRLAAYGQVGFTDLAPPWEETQVAEKLREDLAS